MTATLPDAAPMAWWLTSWLRGGVVTDLVLDELAECGSHVEDVDGQEHGWASALGRWRTAGAVGAALAWPQQGNPVGLQGPPGFNTAALAAGEAVVLDCGTGLVPSEVGDGAGTRVWQEHEALPASVEDAGAADRGLRQALLECADALAELDVARWRPEVADELMELRVSCPWTPPEGIPARCVELAGRASRAYRIVELAAVDEGAAVSASEMAARRDVLAPLGRAARTALVAACAPQAWPPDTLAVS